MVEGARLESVYTGNRIEGSNPSDSAIQSRKSILSFVCLCKAPFVRGFWLFKGS